MNTTTETRNATPKQTFALFCATGIDWRTKNLTFDQASALISQLLPLRGNKPLALETANRILAGESIPKAPKAPKGFQEIYDAAHKAGLAAMEACKPTPMMIPGYAPIMGGVCGFAWVWFKDARKPFAKWLVTQKLASKSGCRSGVTMWAGFEIGNQSLTYKEEYCAAFANVCCEHGIECSMGSRID